MALYTGFEQILKYYDVPPNFSGTSFNSDFDFYKFIGHEIFTSFVSLLIRNGCFDILTEILEEEIYLEKGYSQSGSVNFCYISDYIHLLDYRNSRLKLNRASLHSDLLNQRHSTGILSEVVPIDWFIEADFFLYLRDDDWRPWSVLHIGNKIPRFLIEASRLKYAQRLFQPLRVENVEELKKRVVDRIPELRNLFMRSAGFYPLENFNLKLIGNR